MATDYTALFSTANGMPKSYWTKESLTYSFASSLPSYYTGTADENGVKQSFYALDNTMKSLFTNYYGKDAPISGPFGNTTTIANSPSYAADLAPITFSLSSGTGDLNHLGYNAPTLPQGPVQVQTYLPPNYQPTALNYSQKAGDSLVDQHRLEADSVAYQDYAVLHEIGHSLGLQDASSGALAGTVYDSAKYTVMSYNPDAENGNAWARGYQMFDIAALQSLYGANFQTRSDDTTYTFTGNPGLLTIWDGGGTDTIDVSQLATSAKIDLNPGKFSSIGGTNNVGMALTSQLSAADQSRPLIENVNCSSHGDTVYGNSANNVIHGGAGNDIIYGGTGSNTIYGGDGDDTIYANDAAGTPDGAGDILFGGVGNDTFYTTGYDNIGDADLGDKIFVQGTNIAGTKRLANVSQSNQYRDANFLYDLRTSDNTLMVHKTGENGFSISNFKNGDAGIFLDSTSYYSPNMKSSTSLKSASLAMFNSTAEDGFVEDSVSHLINQHYATETIGHFGFYNALHMA